LSTAVGATPAATAVLEEGLAGGSGELMEDVRLVDKPPA
jgi:hypothetical protein